MTADPSQIPERTCAIAIMAKTPRPGFSKTRLCPPLSFEQAAALSAAFLRDTSENLALASRSAPIVSFAAYAPLGTEGTLAPHLSPRTRCILADGSLPDEPGVTGFGRSLWQAIKVSFDKGHAAACVLSSDTPTLPTACLVLASDILLAGNDKTIVLGACDDGGYYLLGMSAPYAGLFSDITWSTASVAETTRVRAAELGLTVVELPPWYDVDDAAALRQLLAETEGYAATVTRQTIARLQLSADLARAVAA